MHTCPAAYIFSDVLRETVSTLSAHASHPSRTCICARIYRVCVCVCVCVCVNNVSELWHASQPSRTLYMYTCVYREIEYEHIYVCVYDCECSVSTYSRVQMCVCVCVWAHQLMCACVYIIGLQRFPASLTRHFTNMHTYIHTHTCMLRPT